MISFHSQALMHCRSFLRFPLLLVSPVSDDHHPASSWIESWTCYGALAGEQDPRWWHLQRRWYVPLNDWLLSWQHRARIVDIRGGCENVYHSSISKITNKYSIAITIYYFIILWYIIFSTVLLMGIDLFIFFNVSHEYWNHHPVTSSSQQSSTTSTRNEGDKTHSNPKHEHIPGTHPPLSNVTIKHERVQGIIQHEEARRKVIPEERLRERRSGRSCDIALEWYPILYTICSHLSTWLPSLDNAVSLS